MTLEFAIITFMLLVAFMLIIRGNRQKGIRPNSLGDISTRIGYDIRDLWAMSYSDRQIKRVERGDITIGELLDSQPEGNRRN